MTSHKLIVTMRPKKGTHCSIEYKSIATQLENHLNWLYENFYICKVTKEQPKRYLKKKPRSNVG